MPSRMRRVASGSGWQTKYQQATAKCAPCVQCARGNKPDSNPRTNASISSKLINPASFITVAVLICFSCLQTHASLQVSPQISDVHLRHISYFFSDPSLAARAPDYLLKTMAGLSPATAANRLEAVPRILWPHRFKLVLSIQHRVQSRP